MAVTTIMDDSVSSIDTTAWTRALDVAFKRVAQGTLCLDDARVEPDAQLCATTRVRGAYISLLDGDTSVLLGMRGAKSDCQTLTRYMMAMEADEVLQDDDVTGAIGEMMNIVAGVVKSEIGSSQLRLGIPMVVSGRVSPASQQRVACRVVTLGDAQVEVLLHHRSRLRASSRIGRAS